MVRAVVLCLVSLATTCAVDADHDLTQGNMQLRQALNAAIVTVRDNGAFKQSNDMWTMADTTASNFFKCDEAAEWPKKEDATGTLKQILAHQKIRFGSTWEMLPWSMQDSEQSENNTVDDMFLAENQTTNATLCKAMEMEIIGDVLKQKDECINATTKEYQATSNKTAMDEEFDACHRLFHMSVACSAYSEFCKKNVTALEPCTGTDYKDCLPECDPKKIVRKAYGFEIDLATAVADAFAQQYEQDVRPEFIQIPIDDSFFGELSFALTNEKPIVDVVMDGVTILESRKDVVDFTCPYFKESIGFVRSPGSVGITTLNGMKNGKKIGVARGTTAETAAKAFFGDSVVQVFNKESEALAKLEDNSLDAVVIERMLGRDWLNDNCDQCTLASEFMVLGDPQWMGYMLRKDAVADTSSTGVYVEPPTPAWDGSDTECTIKLVCTPKPETAYIEVCDQCISAPSALSSCDEIKNSRTEGECRGGYKCCVTGSSCYGRRLLGRRSSYRSYRSYRGSRSSYRSYRYSYRYSRYRSLFDDDDDYNCGQTCRSSVSFNTCRIQKVTTTYFSCYINATHPTGAHGVERGPQRALANEMDKWKAGFGISTTWPCALTADKQVQLIGLPLSPANMVVTGVVAAVLSTLVAFFLY